MATEFERIAAKPCCEPGIGWELDHVDRLRSGEQQVGDRRCDCRYSDHVSDLLEGYPDKRCAVNHTSKSVVREIRTLRSVGVGGGRLPPTTRQERKRGDAPKRPKPPRLFSTLPVYPVRPPAPDAQSCWAERTQARIMSPSGRLSPVCTHWRTCSYRGKMTQSGHLSNAGE
jgi:hypothetical protein